MNHKNRMKLAIASSIVINLLAITWVGHSELLHPQKPFHKKHKEDLKPVPVKIASIKQTKELLQKIGSHLSDVGNSSSSGEGSGNGNENANGDGESSNKGDDKGGNNKERGSDSKERASATDAGKNTNGNTSIKRSFSNENQASQKSLISHNNGLADKYTASPHTQSSRLSPQQLTANKNATNLPPQALAKKLPAKSAKAMQNTAPKPLASPKQMAQNGSTKNKQAAIKQMRVASAKIDGTNPNTSPVNTKTNGSSHPAGSKSQSPAASRTATRLSAHSKPGASNNPQAQNRNGISNKPAGLNPYGDGRKPGLDTQSGNKPTGNGKNNISLNPLAPRSHTGSSAKNPSTATGKQGRIGSQKIAGELKKEDQSHIKKNKADLGTVHVTRPKQGTVVEGNGDTSNTDVKAKFKIDDPQNKKIAPKPDTILGKRTTIVPKNSNSNNASKSKEISGCVPVGGNTIKSGTTRVGNRNFSGLKYCVLGIGGAGAPTGGKASTAISKGGINANNAKSSQTGSQSNNASHVQGNGKTGNGRTGKDGLSQAGRNAASSDQIISKIYNGAGGITRYDHKWGHSIAGNDSRYVERNGVLHLPGQAANNNGNTPGSKVPEPYRKWVNEPKEHNETGPQGKYDLNKVAFNVKINDVGSLSKNGTVDWGRPQKAKKKKKPLGGDGTGLLGYYFQGENFERLMAKHPDKGLDFDFFKTKPYPGYKTPLPFSVRWVGKLVPKYTEAYTLLSASDDGVRVYFDGKLIISDWTIHAPSEDSAVVFLQAGHEYPITIEYMENGYGEAVMKLYWESAHTPRQYIPESCLRYPKTPNTQTNASVARFPGVPGVPQ